MYSYQSLQIDPLAQLQNSNYSEPTESEASTRLLEKSRNSQDNQPEKDNNKISINQSNPGYVVQGQIVSQLFNNTSSEQSCISTLESSKRHANDLVAQDLATSVNLLFVHRFDTGCYFCFYIYLWISL